MTPLYRFLAARFGDRLAPHLLAVVYAAILLASVLLGDFRDVGQIIYLDMP